MKHLLLVLLFLVGCTSTPSEATTKKPPTVVIEPPQPPLQDPEKPVLAWAKSKYYTPEWDATLYAAIDKNNLPLTTAIPCKKTPLKQCFALLAAKMTEYESSFNPSTEYEEEGDLKGVTSTGLFQISIVSSNSYGCGFKTQKELHNPLKNISCAVDIISKWTRQSGHLINPDLKNAKGKHIGGCSAYWSVCRKTSKSYPKIMSYMSNF